MEVLKVSCPQCQHKFEPGGAFMKDYETLARQKMAAEWQKLKAEVEKDKASIQQQKELLAQQQQQQEQEVQLRLTKERQKLEAQLQESIRRSVASDYENKLRMLESSCAEGEEKLKEARKKELDFLQKEQSLKNREAELELNLQKRLNEEREKLSSEIRGIENQKLQQQESEFRMKLAEKEKQLEDQKKLAEEMRRKAEQGSMQLQGEVQELLLEDILRTGFPFDKVVPVGKGVRGADCMQIVCNPFGSECGKIIYESKRTNNFSHDWIDKLKADMRSQGADIAVIVTQTMPRDMERFGEKEGVYVCSFNEVRSLSMVLRTSILKVFQLTKNQENKGDKMHLLYDYLTSNEFAEQWKAIREGFMHMRLSIQKEREAMERLWKSREKQLEKVLLNAAHIRGSIEGIAGSDAVNMSLLEDNDTLLLD
ncbi:DUF2130 domain-containing protein [Segetibacter sp. 3557_3]|uniref:DUF2130 domain-containing protein n=1 Tax=Segetibacter sp. 3557_3 TaxID=2547429 RepID=UPI001058CF16|nr:DUF2130 domain-containing protein [Segetibacter sp. 3557_3]TDH24239.1 DUF2130 domain-containing protein [Segetibacter sp. 3557_3]